MTDFNNFKIQIAEWANRQDWSDTLVTSFVRMAEQKFNQDLRVSYQIKTADNIVTQRCAVVPDNWLSMNLLSIANMNVPSGYIPIRYKSNDEFFNLVDKRAWGYYTIMGRTVYFGGTPDDTEGTPVRMSYYSEVPVFADDTDSWVYTKFPNLYLMASLMHADLHAVGEEDKALGLKTQVDDIIGKLNAQWLVAKASGSRITRTRKRGFG
jgi:hypothetical protein